eukprot:jgi/Phyca11/18655/fgenesh1_pg.PHYCAscaffold_39_\
MAAPGSPTPYQYHVDDTNLFAVDKMMEVTCEEARCVYWCMQYATGKETSIGVLTNSFFDEAKIKITIAVRLLLAWSRYATGKETSIGVLTNSFFDEAKIKITIAVRLLLAWCMRLPQANAAELAGVSVDTVHYWHASCRSTCSKELPKAEFKIGGVADF